MLASSRTFSGLEINMESLKSLVGGGIVFATPSDPQSRLGSQSPGPAEGK
jgi:paraquat-inducible protein B